MAIARQTQKLLRQIADTLPPVFYTVQESQLWSGEDLLLTGIQRQEDDEAIDKDKDYYIDSPVHIASNHYRRLKRAYQAGGSDAVSRYVRKVNELQELSQSNN